MANSKAILDFLKFSAKKKTIRFLDGYLGKAGERPADLVRVRGKTRFEKVFLRARRRVGAISFLSEIFCSLATANKLTPVIKRKKERILRKRKD